MNYHVLFPNLSKPAAPTMWKLTHAEALYGGRDNDTGYNLTILPSKATCMTSQILAL
jgi:hypothetical protein